MKTSQSTLAQDTASIDDVERYEIIDGVRVEREPMGAFETMLASWLCHLLNDFAAGQKLGRAVSEMLFVLEVSRKLQRRPDVAFVSYGRWPTPAIARESAWNVVPDLAIEVVSARNTRAELARKRREYFSAGVRLVWEINPRTRTVIEYAADDAGTPLPATGALDGGAVLPGFRVTLADLFAELDRHG